MTIYEIDDRIRRLLESDAIFNAETGEILSDELFAQLNNLEVARETKIENTLLYIKNLEAETIALKGEADKLAARKKSKESRVESLKSYVVAALGGQRFETARVSASFRASEKVDVTCANLLPEIYVTIIPAEKRPDKVAIKKAIKAGISIPGATLVLHSNLQIK